MTKKIIAVAGATGAQGGGLVRSILADPSSEFAVRAITRDPDSPKARALAAAGAEVVAADIADKAAVARAFDGAYGAYCVTFFWNHFSPDQERAEAHALAGIVREKTGKVDAAKDCYREAKAAYDRRIAVVVRYPESARRDVAELERLLDTVNQGLADYERLRMIVVAREPWSIENGCLTPTMKIRRSRIEAAVAPQVERWYADHQKVQWA